MATATSPNPDNEILRQLLRGRQDLLQAIEWHRALRDDESYTAAHQAIDVNLELLRRRLERIQIELDNASGNKHFG
jgi:hypothetical protein